MCVQPNILKQLSSNRASFLVNLLAEVTMHGIVERVSLYVNKFTIATMYASAHNMG